MKYSLCHPLSREILLTIVLSASKLILQLQRPVLVRSSRFCVYFFSSSSCNLFLAWQQSSQPANGTANKTFNRTLGLT